MVEPAHLLLLEERGDGTPYELRGFHKTISSCYFDHKDKHGFRIELQTEGGRRDGDKRDLDQIRRDGDLVVVGHGLQFDLYQYGSKLFDFRLTMYDSGTGSLRYSAGLDKVEKKWHKQGNLWKY